MTRAIGDCLMLAIAATLGCSPDAARPSGAQTARPASQDKSHDSGEVVARVGDRTITVSELEASFPGRPGRERRRAHRPGEYRAALERKIDLLLVEEEAAERGITLDPEYIAQRNAILGQAERIARELLRTRLLEEIAAEMEVSEDELKARMEQVPRRFQTRKIHLRRLVVEDEAAAKAAAQRIAAGESFADVAAEVSTDPALRRARGDLGPLERSALPPGIGSRARALRTEGEVSEPFRAEGKWNLIQLVGARDVARPSEGVRPELEQGVRAAKAAQALPQLLLERRAALGVSIDEERLATLGRAEPKPPAPPAATQPVP